MEDKAKIGVSGAGVNLQVPVPGLTLLSPTVTVQLFNSTNSICWGAQFDMAHTTKNTVDGYKGKVSP